MKKALNIRLGLTIVALLLLAVIYASVNKVQDNPKATVEVIQRVGVATPAAQGVMARNELPAPSAQDVGKHDHEEGSAACQEKHAKGECKGHEPGQPHHMEKGDNPGHGHKEGSGECKDKHAKGECKAHEPGQPHREKHAKPNK